MNRIDRIILNILLILSKNLGSGYAGLGNCLKKEDDDEKAICKVKKKDA